MRSFGSSPHTRGAQLREGPGGLGHRIIPAYAGSTYYFPFRRRFRGDHPRIRGEHRSPIRRRPATRGSSPHTRGAQKRSDGPHGHEWIIPAYAGSTRRSRSPRAKPADHPRIRGEHARKCSSTRSGAGSSPHTRGAPTLDVGGAELDGIIPAYAGSTATKAKKPRSRQDHPRIRGEHELVVVGHDET